MTRLNLEKLKLTDEEIYELEQIYLSRTGLFTNQDLINLQLAKTLWGLIDFIKENPPAIGWAFLMSELKRQGVERVNVK